MLNSKFDLYKTEWLDLVFENRNKTYGAYELRQHYASTMVRAMGIAFLAISVVFGGSLLFMRQPKMIHVTVVDNNPNLMKLPVEPIKKIDPPKPAKSLKATPAKPAATIKDPQMVVTRDEQAVNPPKNEVLNNSVISNVDAKGTAEKGNDLPDVTPGNGNGSTPGPDNTVHSLGDGLDVMPEPVGGAEAWAKFLRKNLRFPAAAQDEGVSGKVILSFVIEKDGSLSNIVVERPAGHGFDEEAMRVLKLAKAWKPGQQNGQAVRVKYMIPINFQVSNGD
ncbi:protein TonB [Mucilaginibacter frigoritolerans]|uniref:Protein TonB n=1 Tax=Mucilaginibacter frigoritolerans TaxID=652788 RepID=A0A562TTA0_9SPHI|nr:energy transducer TonB [Mucilaginibacter frigoritolerans]TWI96663.1 protein TonB [Mucilaginibacter frigoritolerans]